MHNKQWYIIFLALNFQIIEPKISFTRKINNFFSDPENKKMMLNVATGAICATGVSLIVAYRHELAELLWGNDFNYRDPFVNPIFIGEYPCKGLEREYKKIAVKQIRVATQSGAQCGVYALASAASWVHAKDGKTFVERMGNAELVNGWVHECIQSNSLIKKVRGQWVLEEALWQGVNNLPNHRKSNERVMVIGDKNAISDTVVDNFLVPEGDEMICYKNIIPEIKNILKSNENNNSPVHYSIIVGTMEHSVIKPNEGIHKKNSPLGHWYTVNIAVKAGELEIVVTDSLNGDHTNDKTVRNIIDTLLQEPQFDL